ncbi:glycosyltransferase family 2 protein [Candidatus Dojkabacteria bacterium]|nr:glycosyltransferase family 2 protein [Candidatus Dojkabacteria bacterium]
MKKTVCAVIVTYNRKAYLIECLRGIKRQKQNIDAVYLIDNASTDGTPELLLKEGFINDLPQTLNEPTQIVTEMTNFNTGESINFYYVRMSQNTGGAGGFHEGVKRAHSAGYDWLWLMDDDAELYEDALKTIYPFCDESNVSALACSIIGLDGKPVLMHRGYFNLENPFKQIVTPVSESQYGQAKIKIDHASFVGILVNSKAIDKIGYPNAEFFIHYDDLEYCLRLREYGEVFFIPSSRVLHKEGASSANMEKRLLWLRSNRIQFEKYWLTYFGKRNLTWLSNKYCTSKINFWIGLIRHALRTLTGVILFDDNKIRRTRMIVSAYGDGLSGRFDNNRSRTILYGKLK